MKCPLYFIGRTTVIPREGEDVGACIKEECAWWHTSLEECRLVTLTDSISIIQGVLLNLRSELATKGVI